MMKYKNYWAEIVRGSIFLLLLAISLTTNAQFIAHSTTEEKAVHYLDLDQISLSDIILEAGDTKVELPILIGGQSGWIVEPQKIFSDAYHIKRPDVKTYRITSSENSIVFGNLMITENGFWASFHSSNGLVTIFPNEKGRLIIETGMSNHNHDGNQCTHNSLDAELEEYIKQNGKSDSRIENFSNGALRNEFRLALVCTGEYYALNGNNDNIVLDKMASAMLGINAIFEKEIAVRFTPIDLDVFRDQNTDPFDPDMDENRPDEASQGVSTAFPSGNYDIGHVFHRSVENDGWGSGGIARLAAVCNDNVSNGGPVKAKGWSGSFNTDGNGFISLAAHEFAHMFAATHTFNGDGGFGGSTTCTDAASATSAYEIGSGTTIMSYQGLCDEDQNVASSGVADHYFHVHSLFQMINFINDQAFECANSIPLNNTPPNINPNECGGNILIPKNTPFYLKGSADDSENDVLLYCWEQYNEDGAGTPTLGQIGALAGNSSTAPLFRSFPPTTESIRYFPDLTTLAEGANSDPFQVLANRDRNLIFQFTVRDQNSDGGGIATEELEVQVQSEGPLSIQNLNAITAGEPTNITWNTNNTDALCDKAKLLLSIDGGQTYPFTVAEDFDYASGSTSFTLPSPFPSSTEGRLMIACDDNECFSFFDITDNDLNITSDCLAGASIICDSDYQVYDQGEPALDLDLKHYDGEVVSSLSGTLTISSDSYSLTYWNQSQTGCKETVATNRGDSRRITVDKSGTYSFSIDFEASTGDEIFNIHTADNFSVDNPCPSFLNSNSFSNDDGAISWTSTSVLTADLVACEEYIITFYINTSSHPQSYSMPTITGPGNVIEIDTDPDPNFSSTFIAVNENGIIEVVSPTSDFTALSGGLYDIYTVSYKSGGVSPPDNADPISWAGSSLVDIQTENCMLLSSNRKQILVEFTCRVNNIKLGTQTSCDANSNTYSQEVIVTYESPPITGNLVVNGITVPISGSPQTINLTGLISDGQPVGVSAAFSELESCSMFISELFVAPENCCAIDFDLGGDRSVCSGEVIILDAGSDGVDYKWFKDGGLLENDIISTYAVTESGNYLVEVINDVGCAKFDVVNITIFDTPTVTLEEDKSVCEGEIFNLPAMTTANELQWYKDNAELMGETDGTLLITEAGQYHIIGTNSYPLPSGEILGCFASDTVNIEYVTRPIVMLGDDQEWCEGDPDVILDAGQDGTEYTWARNGIVIASETSDQLSVSETGQYTVIVDKGGGCDDKDTVNITFYELAEVFAGQDVNVCEGNSTTLNPFIEAVSFEWYFGGALFGDQSAMPEVSEGGEYILVGYNEIGCSINDTVQVNQVMPPMPDLGDDRVGCIGSEIVLGVEGIGNVVWTLNSAPISMEDTITITEPGTYGVTILAANDCNGFDEIDITFEEGPTLSLGDDDSYCAGETYTINAITNGDNITWFKDGVEIMGESGFDLSVTGSGMYSAIVEGTSGCSAEDLVMIIENEVPTVEFTEDETICDGEAAMLVGPEGADTYQWIYGGTVISDQQSISVTEEGDYTLVVTNEFDCSASDIVDVIVSSVPTLDLAPSFAICEGEDVEIIADSDASSFQWIVNGVTLMNETGSSIILNSESMVEVIATSIGGCTSMASTSVAAAESPIVNLGDDISLCSNDDITFNAGMHTTYLWSDGSDGSTLTIFNDADELTSITYAVTVTNAEGCTATDEVEVTLFPPINGTIEQSASGVCNGAPVVLTATGGTMYTWIDESGTLLDIDGPNATAFPSESTTYQVIIGDDCGNETFEIVIIDVFEAADDVDAGDDDCAVNGKTVELNATGGVSYQWVDDSSIDSGANTSNPTVSPEVETIYFVDITDENGCIYRDSVSICILDDPLEFFELISIITPNGDGDNDELIFSGLESEPNNTITIYNRWGYPVFERKGYQSGGELWNGENGGDILPADTYYYVLTINGETFKSPITIMR